MWVDCMQVSYEPLHATKSYQSPARLSTVKISRSRSGIRNRDDGGLEKLRQKATHRNGAVIQSQQPMYTVQDDDVLQTLARIPPTGKGHGLRSCEWGCRMAGTKTLGRSLRALLVLVRFAHPLRRGGGNRKTDSLLRACILPLQSQITGALLLSACCVT